MTASPDHTPTSISSGWAALNTETAATPRAMVLWRRLSSPRGKEHSTRTALTNTEKLLELFPRESGDEGGWLGGGDNTLSHHLHGGYCGCDHGTAHNVKGLHLRAQNDGSCEGQHVRQRRTYMLIRSSVLKPTKGGGGGKTITNRLNTHPHKLNKHTGSIGFWLSGASETL